MALNRNSKDSAILTTSNNFRIAEHVGDGSVYTLAPLSKTDSGKLFYGRLFPSEGKCPPELTEISKTILRKCGGIPLAIIATIDLLASKSYTVKDWQAVNEHFGYELQQGRYDVRRIVTPSYNDLPLHLKFCLLYLGMFQRGYEISGDRLIWGWIAQGFIPNNMGRTLQEVGESWLNELIDRNLVESVEVDASGKPLSFRVYGLIHDLIVSLLTEENVATILYGQQGGSLKDTVYQLSIRGNTMPEVRTSLSPVWSLVVSGDASLMPSLSEFKNLRIMDLGGCESLQNEHLNGVGRLVLLVCLVLRGACITDIPKDIGGLTFLETLDLRGTSIKELPESIVQLIKLKRLYVDSRTKIPNGIEKLEALEELGDVSIKNFVLLREVSKLERLRVLRIAIWSWDESYDNSSLLKNLQFLGRGKQQIQSLSILSSISLRFLDDLDVKWPSLQKLEIRHNTFDKLPAWLCSVENLTSLSIEVDKLSRDIVDMLGNIKNLSSLSVTSKQALDETEERSGIGASGFSKLTSFHIFSNAMEKLFEPGAMPSLTMLRLSFQASRTNDVNRDFDFGLENLSSLELKHVHVEIICFNATLELVEEAEAAIEDAISRNLNCHPNLKIQRIREEDMMKHEVEDIANDMKQEEQQKEIKKERCRSYCLLTEFQNIFSYIST